MSVIAGKVAREQPAHLKEYFSEQLVFADVLPRICQG